MLMSRLQDPELIAGFYHAAANPDGWDNAWAAVCHAFGAENGLLFEQAHPKAAPRIVAATNREFAALTCSAPITCRAMDRCHGTRACPTTASSGTC
ncbi:MAG: hypothetical protein WDN04_21710 [Rhodospirillales bacterium]